MVAYSYDALMRRITLRIVLGILAAWLIALAVTTRLQPRLLTGWPSIPVWAWSTLAAITCGIFSATWWWPRFTNWIRALASKLIICVLKLLQKISLWIIQTRAFKHLVLGSRARGFLTWFVWKALTHPETLNIPDTQATLLLSQLEESLDKRKWGQSVNENERDRAIAFNQAQTWGVAGAATLLLTTVILGEHPTDGAAVFAGACFAAAIPILIACGLIQKSYSDSDNPTLQPPSLREGLAVIAKMQFAQLLVCIGLIALLWNYNWIVSVVFIIACMMAWRLFRRSVMERAKTPEATGGPVMPPPPARRE